MLHNIRKLIYADHLNSMQSVSKHGKQDQVEVYLSLSKQLCWSVVTAVPMSDMYVTNLYQQCHCMFSFGVLRAIV